MASKATSKTSNQDTFILRRPRIIIILLTSAKFQSCRVNKPLKTYSKSKESGKVYQNVTFTFICICDIAKLVNFSCKNTSTSRTQKVCLVIYVFS